MNKWVPGSSVHRHDLLIEPREATFVLADQQWFEAALSIPPGEGFKVAPVHRAFRAVLSVRGNQLASTPGERAERVGAIRRKEVQCRDESGYLPQS